jgi:hypothetical protein
MPGEVEPSEGAGTSNWRSDLRRALEQHFGEEDIEVLCFDLNVPYDNLSGTNLPLKIVSLITYLAQRGRIAELIDACSKQRENVDWEALKRAALADPSAGEIAPGTDEDEPSARDEERQQTDATEATAAPDERQAGRLVRAAVVTLPRWAVYLAIAIVVGLAGLLLARFVFFPSPAPSGGGRRRPGRWLPTLRNRRATL